MHAWHKAVDITPEHARQLQLSMRAAGFSFFVAPYEADAQLAQLARAGHVSVVVTEDSDLLTFGCPCVLYKMQEDGSGQLIRLQRLAAAQGPSGALFTPWEEWDQGLFLDLCILAGCDYLPHLPDMAIKTAHGLLATHRNVKTVVRIAY